MRAQRIAFIASLVVTLFSTLFYWVIIRPEVWTLMVCGILSFTASYVILYFVLETYFFKHIKNIYGLLDKMKVKNYHVHDTGNPLLKMNRELTSYVNRKEDEIEKLKQLENFRREFIADISHELKTPLFAAQGFVHTLLDGAVKDKSVRDKFLQKAARSLDGLDSLVQDLLTISQIESGSIVMQFENFDIIALAQQVIEQMEVKAGKRDMTLELANEPSESIYVHADHRRMYQVLTNLVSNGIKYSKKGKKVTLRFQETDTGVLCEVIDQGYGIPEEDLGRIFERFYRVDKSRSKERGGTGLGLAIVKHIMEGHGVQVNVQTKIKKGSKFSFELIKGSKVPSQLIEDDE